MLLLKAKPVRMRAECSPTDLFICIGTSKPDCLKQWCPSYYEATDTDVLHFIPLLENKQHK